MKSKSFDMFRRNRYRLKGKGAEVTSLLKGCDLVVSLIMTQLSYDKSYGVLL